MTWNGRPFGDFRADLGPNGHYTLSLPPGALTLSIKHTHWLRRTVAADTTGGPVAGVNFDLVNGDAFDDNTVDLADLNSVLVRFGSAGGMEDLDEDGEVALPDLSVTLLNFALTGDG